ncbi:MAG TPA: hypothetical protein VJS37_03050 [Terriglobales bacterium]|nr:hypothetical protein [Terriglobales bacterium]
MSTNFATKRLSEVSSGTKPELVLGFYLLTFLMGGFFLFVGGRVSLLVDLTGTASYIAVTLLFYALSKGA